METLKSLESSFIGLVSLIWMFLYSLASRQISLNNMLWGIVCFKKNYELRNFVLSIDLKLERGFFDLLFDIFSYLRSSLWSHCFDFDKVSWNILRQIWISRNFLCQCLKKKFWWMDYNVTGCACWLAQADISLKIAISLSGNL